MAGRGGTAVTLWPCDPRGRPLAAAPPNPWTRYLAWADGQWVGGGGFTGPPRRGRVEIGYFTLPDQRRRGHGRGTASALLALARAVDCSLTIVAHTRRQPVPGDPATDPAASAHILQSLGFGPPRAGRDPRVGPVWRWALRPTRPGQRPHAPTIGA
jgi:RimJ/RimL family protein N-acetyltransferase